MDKLDSKPVYGNRTRFCTQKSSTELSRHKPYRQSITYLVTTGTTSATCQTAGTTTPTGNPKTSLRLGRLIWTLNSVRISEYSSLMSCPIDILIKNLFTFVYTFIKGTLKVFPNLNKVFNIDQASTTINHHQGNHLFFISLVK